jgi:uncharacterized protein
VEATPDSALMPELAPTASPRQLGLDVARALAIFAMIVVHFTLVMSKSDNGPAWLSVLLGFFDGRAAATFVILAGMGVTLMPRKAVRSHDSHAINQVRRVLTIRGVILLTAGFLNLVIWPGDILRVYGVSLLLAAYLITSSNRTLLLWATGIACGFIVLFCVLDFEEHWKWETFSYRGLWTASGLVRNLFYDGFRSVFPWTGLLIFGMWLGRLRLDDPAVNTRVAVAAIGTAIVAEVASATCIAYFLAHPHGMEEETIRALFGTESMPALPLFLLASGGEAVAVIALCVRLVGERSSNVVQPLVATGQMALTWYIAHIIFGLGGIVALELEATQSQLTAACAGLCFFAGAALFSSIWMRYFRRGPLEAAIRALAGQA